MKTNYSKTCTLPQDLILLLRNRGLSIPDEQRAISYLTNIGYFRLSAYLYPLLKEPKTDHRYKDGATFEMALNMYRFDRKLRVLLFNEIEKIEVAIRSAIINWVSHDLNDVFWIADAMYFHNHNVFSKTLKLIQSEINKSTAEFILHFRNKYSNPYPPAWMIAETVTLGIMCVTYGNLKSRNIQKKAHLLPYLHHQIPAVYRFAQQLLRAKTEIAAGGIPHC
jgi:abortive infection bacteriophage resistance protein